MRAALTVLASLAWWAAPLAIESPAWEEAAAQSAPEPCCCCSSAASCPCGCAPPPTRPDEAPKAPIRSLCSCDDLPAANLGAGRCQLPQPRKVAFDAAAPDFCDGVRPSPVTEVWEVSHGPPPDLAHIRTFVMLT